MQIAWSCNKEDLVALLCVSIRTTFRMAIRFAADCLAICALQGDVHFVKGLEGSGDCSDAAHKQYCKENVSDELPDCDVLQIWVQICGKAGTAYGQGRPSR